jgi:hypothetical protein
VVPDAAVVQPTLPRGAESGLDVLTVLTLQAAGAGDFYGGTKRLSNKMPRRPVVGRIPMHCLVFDLL